MTTTKTTKKTGKATGRKVAKVTKAKRQTVKAKTAKPAKRAAARKGTKATPRTNGKFNWKPGDVILVKNRKSPYQAGSIKDEQFKLLTKYHGKTPDSFIAAGGKRGRIKWAVKRGNVELRKRA